MGVSGGFSFFFLGYSEFDPIEDTESNTATLGVLNRSVVTVSSIR